MLAGFRKVGTRRGGRRRSRRRRPAARQRSRQDRRGNSRAPAGRRRPSVPAAHGRAGAARRNRRKTGSHSPPQSKNLTENFKRLLASPAIASKGWITEQYDTMVRTNTLAVPGAGDAAVVRIKGTKRALALATDGNGRWCQLNPRLGAMHAVAEAARNVACSGARPIAATNCLNFGSPEKPEVMWQFSEVIDGLAAACNALETPITGGNVSFYNETLGASIFPTPVIGISGRHRRCRQCFEARLSQRRRHYYFAGRPVQRLRRYRGTASAQLSTRAREFSSSEYSKTIAGIVAGQPPAIDLAAEKRLQKLSGRACLVARASIRARHQRRRPGSHSRRNRCFAGGTWRADDTRTTMRRRKSALFGERGARAVISISASSLDDSAELRAQYGVSATSHRARHQ